MLHDYTDQPVIGAAINSGERFKPHADAAAMALCAAIEHVEALQMYIEGVPFAGVLKRVAGALQRRYGVATQ